ncbi:MAG: hypothetical protein WC606_04415 [Candidatus Absconditabacterales bacterium]|jgi:hypothetical protein
MTFTEKILEKFKICQNSEHFMSKLQEAGFKVYPIYNPKPYTDQSRFILVNGEEVALVLSSGHLAMKDQQVGIQILENDPKKLNECEWYQKSRT